MDMNGQDFFYQWEVLGEPVGKGRPRVTTRGGYAHAYTPKKTTEYEQQVRDAFYAKYGEVEMLEGVALELFVRMEHGIPKSVPKKDLPYYKDNLIKPMKKPDSDNVIKGVTDALNGYVFKDDVQIVYLIASKRWSTEPKVVIQIREARDY